jgi:hypothetical protein
MVKKEYYMIEYEYGDSEELRQKTVERYIVTENTKIDQLQRLTRLKLQAKTAIHNQLPTMTTTNNLPPHHVMAVFKEKTGKMLE